MRDPRFLTKNDDGHAIPIDGRCVTKLQGPDAFNVQLASRPRRFAFSKIGSSRNFKKITATDILTDKLIVQVCMYG